MIKRSRWDRFGKRGGRNVIKLTGDDDSFVGYSQFLRRSVAMHD